VVDAQANIRVNLDTDQAFAQLKALEQQISVFNKSIVQGTAEAQKFQQNYTSSLLHNINKTGMFSASMGKVATETDRFTEALESNKLSGREYFRYTMASTKTFGKLFGKEFSTITNVAEERVKLLQTRHIELGRAADGSMRAIKVVPNSLDYSKPLAQMQLAAQRQQIFNQLLDTGTTKLLNFGKNTQWAGRQLMVGFTIPLSILGGMAIRVFRDMENQAIRFKKVYGDMFTGEGETQRALENIQKLGKEFTKYGVTVADTVKLAADAAAAGNTGKQLENIVTQTTRLSVLGDITAEKAFDATLAIQSAFRTTGVELTNTINFLNAVENQTVVALEDITEAIPRVASVIQVLGGDVKDLALFMAAMKEGGVQAADGANALKTSLGRLINPTKAAVNTAADLGINLKAIVDENAGDLRTIMLTFAEALKPLDDLSKARLMEKVFGKFQFARMSTLFDNLSRSGSQAARVMELTGQSTEQLAMLAEKELGTVADSAATKFTASIEKLKVALVPVGEAFIKLVTPIINFFTKILDKFNSFSDTTKSMITGVLAVLGGIGPVLLMGVGLVANGIANLLKLMNLLRKGYQGLAGGSRALGLGTDYLSKEQLEAVSVANNLRLVHERLTDRFAIESIAVKQLTTAYLQAAAAARTFATNSAGLFVPGAAGKIGKVPKFGGPIKMAEGGFVPGTGNKDTVPAVLMPGEFVVKKDAAQSNKELLKDMNNGGGTYRGLGTPSFGKVELRSGGTKSKTTSSNPQSLQDVRNAAHVDVRKTLPNETIKDLLKDPNLTGESKERLRIAAGTTNPKLTISDLRRLAYDVGVRDDMKSISQLTEKQLQSEIKSKLNVKTMAQARGLYSTFLNGYTSEVVDMNQKIQNAMTGRGADGRSLSTRAEILKDISRNRYTFSYGLYEGILKDIPDKDLRMQDKVRIMRKVAKNTEKSVKIQFKTNEVVPDEKFRDIYRKAQDDALRSELKNKPALLNQIEEKVQTQRNKITALRVKGEKTSSVFRKGVGSDSYKQFSKVSGVRESIFTALGKTESLKKYFDQKVATVSSKTPKVVAKYGPKVGRFGAAASIATTTGLFGAAAAQALQNRSTGTPAYGEQGVTPAMLTPGEFVVNSKATQKFGPALQAMNSGDVAYRNEGTKAYNRIVKEAVDKEIKAAKTWGEGKEPTKAEKKEIEKRVKANLKAQGITLAKMQRQFAGQAVVRGAEKALIRVAGDQTGQTISPKEQAKLDKENNRSQKENIKARDKNTKATNKSTKAVDKTTSQVDKEAKRERFRAGAQRAGGAMMIGGMVAMGVGMATDGKTSEVANQIGQVAMILSLIAYALPALTKLPVALTAIGVGIVAAIYFYNKAMKQAAQDGFKAVQLLGTTAEEIKKVSESTGKVSTSMIGQRMREERITQYTPVVADFGAGYIDSEAGQMLMDQIKEFEKRGMNSVDAIAFKLATYVADGLMSAAEAESVTQELGRQLGSTTFSINLSGRLQELIGFGGINLLENPMIVRVKLVEELDKSTSSFIESKREELKTLQDQNFFERGSAAYKQAKEEGEGELKAQWANIKSKLFGTKLAQKEIAGMIAGQNSMLLATSQQQIDAARVENELKIEELNTTEKILEAQLKSTTNASNLLKIELELELLRKQRDFREKSFNTENAKLMEMNKRFYFDLASDFDALDKKAKKTTLQVTESNLRDRYKGTAEQGVLSEVLKTTKGFEDKTLTYRINTLIDSDQLSATDALRLIEMFPEEKNLSITMDALVRTQGLEALNRTLIALAGFKDENANAAAGIFKEMSRMSPTNFEAASKFLEAAQGIPAEFFNINDETANILLNNPEILVKAGKDLLKIEQQLADIDKFKGEEKKKRIVEFITDPGQGGRFNELVGKMEYFDSLADGEIKEFFTIFTVITRGYDELEAQDRFLEKGTSMGWRAMSPSAKEEWWRTNVALPDTQEFFELKKKLAQYDLEPTEPEGGGSKSSLPTTIKQLIELRLKGLDPAAAAELDFDAAAKVLTGSVKQQKAAIAELNKEIRESSIRAQVLKTDQEVLNDTLKANTDAIGAYIGMVEQIEIKPIQDQIDKFNDLSEAQQSQIEKYQKGLKDLSDKEEAINKIYDERIEAIDKVSQANERSAQRQQRQIDLASAIASGDFAAAASAAADISASEAGYRLEDARAALEETRQQELKNLTIEINGQLYTREQIETNIKNLEEEIYKRTTLIKQEQEKILEIEKRINIEKEKRRKLDALIQMSQLASRLETTVNPTERNLLTAQMGFIGESIGISDLSSQGQFTELGRELGQDLSGMSAIIKTSMEISVITSQEMNTAAEDVKRNVKNLKQFMDDSTVEGSLALGFLQTLTSSWGNTETGLAANGQIIQDSIIGTAVLLVQGNNVLKDTIENGLTSINNAAANAVKTISDAVGSNYTYQGTNVPNYTGAKNPTINDPSWITNLNNWFKNTKAGSTYLNMLRGNPMAMGGSVKKYAMGGNINYKGSTEPAPVRMAFGNIAPGLGNTDRVPALLTPGEFVVRKSVAQENMGLLQALNGDVFPKINSGISASVPLPETNTVVQGETNLYNNYSVNVNVADTNASAEDIAGVVINKIKSINDRSMRGNRF
jgi:TP901 family phage tail tape measure protein